MASNLYQRYFWLINVIYRNKRITLKDINDKWLNCSFSNGVTIPRKTFNNHRNTIEEIFDINIECDRATNEYYRYVSVVVAERLRRKSCPERQQGDKKQNSV